MKTVNKVVISIVATLGFGIAIPTVNAQPGPMGNGPGPGMMRGGVTQGQTLEQNANWKIMRELMTPAERLDMMDKLIDAKSFEERQSIMRANHLELEKRAKEKGITLPRGYGSQMMFGRNCR